MATATSAQVSARYDRLKRSATIIEPSSEKGKQLRDVALYILHLYPIGEPTGTSTTVVLAPVDEVKESMRSLLPSSEYILTVELLRSPLFPVALLRDFATVYGSDDVPDGLTSALELSAGENGNCSIMTHVWFTHLLGCSHATIRAVVDTYRRTRGSLNLFIRQREAANVAPDGTLAGSQTNPQGEAAGDEAIRSEPPSSTPQVRTTERGNGTSQQTPHQQAVNSRLPVWGVRNDNQSTAAAPSSMAEPGVISPLPDTGEDTRKASYVSQHFRDNQFKGGLTQSIDLTLRDYNICSRQHRLSPSQKADCFVNILDGPARTFFFNKAQDDMSFEQMAEMMVAEFNSNARQIQVYGILSTLTISSMMAEHELTSFTEGLTKVVSTIEEMAPQCLPHFRSEPHKIGYFCKAVLVHTSSKTPKSNIVAAQYSFNGLITAIREHMLLEEEILSVSRRPTDIQHSSADDIFVQQYGRNPRYVQKYPPRDEYKGGPQSNGSRPPNTPFPSGGTFEESRRRNECHKCRTPWRPGHRCKSGSIRNQVRQRMINGESAVHVMSDFVASLEGELVQDKPDAAVAVKEQYTENDDRGPTVHFIENEDEVYMFGSLTLGNQLHDTAAIEETDKEWFTPHLSSSMSGRTTQNNAKEQDFLLGDEEKSLNFVAKYDGQLPIVQRTRGANRTRSKLMQRTFKHLL